MALLLQAALFVLAAVVSTQGQRYGPPPAPSYCKPKTTYVTRTVTVPEIRTQNEVVYRTKVETQVKTVYETEVQQVPTYITEVKEVTRYETKQVPTYVTKVEQQKSYVTVTEKCYKPEPSYKPQPSYNRYG
ncbi:unnamed protein product [Meganyctiphanes norvegica]|uniref:Uncharacterized protein n=1 Tax=Meganyctiphanes norvegica TaxID=48144 RepID=A0AAV2R730_MEGNR